MSPVKNKESWEIENNNCLPSRSASIRICFLTASFKSDSTAVRSLRASESSSKASRMVLRRLRKRLLVPSLCLSCKQKTYANLLARRLGKMKKWYPRAITVDGSTAVPIARAGEKWDDKRIGSENCTSRYDILSHCQYTTQDRTERRLTWIPRRRLQHSGSRKFQLLSFHHSRRYRA